MVLSKPLKLGSLLHSKASSFRKTLYDLQQAVCYEAINAYIIGASVVCQMETGEEEDINCTLY